MISFTNDIRGHVAEQVYDGRDGDYFDDCYQSSDRIIAAFAEALLSEPVVEAAVKSVRAWHGDMMPVAKDPNGNDYGPLDDDDWDILADAIITAALAAMGAGGTAQEGAVMINKFAADMKAQRAIVGMTLRELADKVELDFTYLSKIEAGKDVPSERAIQDIANNLGMTTPHIENCLAAGKVPGMVADVLLSMPPDVAASELRAIYERHPLKHD